MFQALKNWLGLAFYVSPLDQYLQQFRSTHPTLTASQRQEQQKYAKIFKWRDSATTTPAAKSFWDKF